MNTIQSTFSSPRTTRILFWLGAAVLAAGIVVLVIKLAGGSDKTSSSPQAGFKAQLPAKEGPLKNAQGVTVQNYGQLDPEIKSTIRTFIATAVARKNLGESWAVIAPSMKVGYTRNQWAHANALPIVPYQVDDVDGANYNLTEATTKEILLEVGLSAKPSLKIRPMVFLIGLVPVGKDGHQRWLVNYWGPRVTQGVYAGDEKG